MSDSPESGVKIIRTESSPEQYIASFRDSETYKKAYEKFYESKKLAEDVTEEEKREAFERQEEIIRPTVFDFARSEVKLRYDDNRYPDLVRVAINNYLFYRMQNNEKGFRFNKEEIISSDREQQRLHLEAARKVGDYLKTTSQVGRAIVSLIAINEGLDDFNSTAETIAQRAAKVA